MGLCCTKASYRTSDYGLKYGDLNRRSSVTSTSSSMDSLNLSFDSFSDRDLPPCFLNQYRLHELIGVGSTAKCYRVSTAAGDEYACKIIDKTRLSSDPRQKNLILRQLHEEVKALQRLRHPNIVELENVIETKEYLFIIMELLKGGELFTELMSRTCFTEAETVDLGRQLVSAVVYMHSRNILHRDIKPENIVLVSNASGRRQIKLIDFGFARTLNYGRAKSFLGTAGYLAPELRQLTYYNAAVDMWALGCIFYLCLSGAMPFPMSSDSIPRKAQLSEYFYLRFPSSRWTGISREGREFVTKLLELDPKKRMTATEAVRHRWLVEERTALNGFTV